MFVYVGISDVVVGFVFYDVYKYWGWGNICYWFYVVVFVIWWEGDFFGSC